MCRKKVSRQVAHIWLSRWRWRRNRDWKYVNIDTVFSPHLESLSLQLSKSPPKSQFVYLAHNEKRVPNEKDKHPLTWDWKWLGNKFRSCWSKKIKKSLQQWCTDKPQKLYQLSSVCIDCHLLQRSSVEWYEKNKTRGPWEKWYKKKADANKKEIRSRHLIKV